MKQTTAALIERLKEAGEDFEFYPTTKAMVRAIWNHATKPTYRDRRVYWNSVLDIGCGTCNFKRWIEELNEEAKPKNPHVYEYRNIIMRDYYVMEESRILLERLPPETIVLGTDFNESTLIDKEVDTVFCNPPYSVFEEWTRRIILESNCGRIYLIVPERWKRSEEINHAIRRANAVVEVIGHADFLNAERSARAKVDILFVNKENGKDAGFDAFFDEVFGMSDEKKKPDWQTCETELQKLKTELAAAKNKVELLCNGYDAARDELFHHFKTIAGLDADVLKSVGVFKDTVKKALKEKIAGLKNIYWQSAFDCLDEITSRLTSTSRYELLNRFRILKSVDFTPSNLYAMIIWVVKNYNRYTESQMIHLFLALSSKENVRNYVSNKRAFEEYHYRFGDDSPRSSHYTLDYRIIATSHALPGDGRDSSYNPDVREIVQQKISDICAVAYSLGFQKTYMCIPDQFGQPGRVYFDKDEKVLFEFRLYQNRNVHLKFNIELMKALNVAVAQKLGWIRKAEDIKKEFAPDMAAGAEKYFNRFNLCSIDVTRASSLLLPA